MASGLSNQIANHSYDILNDILTKNELKQIRSAWFTDWHINQIGIGGGEVKKQMEHVNFQRLNPSTLSVDSQTSGMFTEHEVVMVNCHTSDKW